jgi:hypothetical protein
VYGPAAFWQRLRLAWRRYLESKTLQDLDRIISRAIEDDATAGKGSVFPLGSVTAEGQDAVFEGTIEKEFAVQSHRFRTESLVLNLIHPVLASFPARPTKGRNLFLRHLHDAHRN